MENIKKKEDKTKTISKKQPTALELAKQLEALQAENEKLKQKQSLSFEDAAKLYKKKAQILKDIAVFNSVLNDISTVIDNLQKENSLISEHYAISLTYGNYNKQTIFSISNIEFIRSFIAFADDKINVKVHELKAEVQAI